MVKVRAGDKKKQLIFETSKKLFYRNGYNNTTYDMICSAADIPAGSIAYHFSSKAALADLVSRDYNIRLINYVKQKLGRPVDHWIMTALIIRARWYLMFYDENIRRFMREVLASKALGEDNFDSTVETLEVHRTDGGLKIDDKQFRLTAALVSGIDQSILIALRSNIYEYDLNYVSEFNTLMFFRILNLGDETAENSAKEAKKLFDEMGFDIAFFKDFAFIE